MNCTKCNSILQPEFSFCPFCGTKIDAAAKNATAEKKPEVSAVTSSDIPKMLDIKGGSFTLGNNEIERKVSLVSFALSETPITQRQFEYVMERNPSKMQGANRPVESVNWCEAIIFCNALSMMQKLEPCYKIGNTTDFSKINSTSPLWKRVSCNFVANGYRLPTEAEWEYAARGGQNQNSALYAGSNKIDDTVWYGENSEVRSHDVGTKAPNELGLFDMCGNVAEWCWDYMGELAIQPQTNPHGPQIGTMHIKRGGGWLDDAEQCTVYYRSGSAPTGKSSTLGFRVARSVIDNVM